MRGGRSVLRDDDRTVGLRCKKDPINAEVVFKVCKSASAKVFKDTWSKFVQEHEIVAEITHMFAERDSLTMLRERVGAGSSNFLPWHVLHLQEQSLRARFCAGGKQAVEKVTDNALAETLCDLIKKSLAIIEKLEEDIPL